MKAMVVGVRSSRQTRLGESMEHPAATSRSWNWMARRAKQTRPVIDVRSAARIAELLRRSRNLLAMSVRKFLPDPGLPQKLIVLSPGLLRNAPARRRCRPLPRTGDYEWGPSD